MKQKFWKQLKSQLCPREQWARDQDITKCQCCGLDFTLFRRRHHCRFCGKIFCNSCCDLYINGNYLGLTQKFVRHCEFCKQQIAKIKRDLNQLTYMLQQEQDAVRDEQEQETDSSSDEDNEYFLLKAIFGDLEKQEIQQATEEMDNEIKNMHRRLIKAVVEQLPLSPEFINSKLGDILHRAVIQTKMNILPLDLDSTASYMDITRQLSIKTIYGQPTQIIELVRGIVLQKTFSMKGMLNRLLKPQVLLIENSLDEGAVANRIKFEDLVCSQKMIIEQLQERVMKLNPDIVFVEKTVSRSILAYFCENKVCVINGLKRKDMDKIIKLTGIRRSIKNMLVNKHKHTDLLGTLDLMHTKKYQQQSLIFLQRNVGIYSIVISERTPEMQNVLKKALQLMVKFMRQMHLEKYLVYVDYEMGEDRATADLPRLYALNPTYNSSIDRLEIPGIEFYRLTLSELALENQDKKMQEYCRIANCECLLQTCGTGRWQHREAYSDQDHTIGHFLLIMATNYLKKCSQCKQNHRQRYYFRERGLQICVRKQQPVQRDGIKIEGEQDLTIQNMLNYLKKYKQNSSIFSYFLCKRCGETLTKKAKIGKNYLKNSFYYFLQLITNSQPPKLLRSKTSKTTPTQRECTHPVVQRVLQTEDILFRMHIFDIDCYTLNLIDLKSQRACMIIEFNTKKYICELICLCIDQRQYFIDSLILSINNYINVLEPMMQSAGSEIIIQQEKLQTIKNILQQLRTFVDQLKQKENKKQVTNNTDWTFFLRQIGKVDHVIKTAIDLLLQIEGKLHKKKVMVEQNDKTFINDNDQFVINQVTIETENPKEQPSELKRVTTSDLSDRSPRRIIVPKLQLKESNKEKSRRDSRDLKNIPYRQTFPRDNRDRSQPESALSYQQCSSKDHSSEDGEKKQERITRNIHRRISQSAFSFSNVLSEDRFRFFTEEMRRRRYPLKKGCYIYFSMINYKNPVSVLAYALNSTDLQEKLSKSTDVYKMHLIVTKEIPTSFDLKQDIEHLKQHNPEDETDTRQNYEVLQYFPKQFEQLRNMEGLPFDLYVRSLTGSAVWDSKGGKRGQFSKSHNSILVIKTVKDEQFLQFLKFASDYLKHVKDSKNSNSYSLLAIIYGLYDVTIRGTSFKYVVMQNIFFELEVQPMKVYDLKGSEVNRLDFPTKGERFTGLDSNFKIDKNYHPYFLQQEVYANFHNVLQDDINFLSKHEVIDYSLMVVETDKTLRLGIIDFMRPYHFKEKIQKTYKELKYRQDPTVLPPPDYAYRFLQAMKRYFTSDKWISS